MRRKGLVVVIVVLMLVFVSIIGMFGSAGANGGGWQYQKEITIKENSGKTLTDYQVLIELIGDDFPSKAKSDGADMRFVDTFGNELSYWIESWDYSGKSAKIWVKLSMIPASGETVITMRYGNPSATSMSNGDAVFEFFDDFSQGNLDKWDGSSQSYIFDDGIVKFSREVWNGPHGHAYKIFDNTQLTITVMQKSIPGELDWWGDCDFCGPMYCRAPGASIRYLDAGETWLGTFYVGYNGGRTEASLNSCDDVHRFRIRYGDWYREEIKAPEEKPPGVSGESKLEVLLKGYRCLGGPAYEYVDWISVRKYASAEPIIIFSTDDGLVAEWHFDEGSGTTVTDSSGNGNDGTIHGATWTTGVSGTALTFDGVDDCTECSLNSALANDLTIELWMKSNYQSSNQDDQRRMLDLGTSSSRGFQLCIDSEGFLLIDNTGGPDSEAPTSSLYNDGNWHHVAGVREGSNYHLYVDGIYKTSTGGTIPSYNYAYIAKIAENWGYFEGTIDEVKIYNRALASDEIKNHYDEEKPTELPDLTFSYEDKYNPDGIYFSSDELLVGESVTIWAMAQNPIGNGDVTDDFNVTFYLGDPDTDGDGVIDDNADEIGSYFIEAPLPSGIGVSAWTKWTPSEVGTFDIYAVIDPEIDTSDTKIGSVVESEEGNNEAHTEVNVIKLLRVPYFNQGGTQWCGPNCVAMVLQYYGKNVHSWDAADYFNQGNQDPLNIDCWCPESWRPIQKYFEKNGLTVKWHHCQGLFTERLGPTLDFNNDFKIPLDNGYPILMWSEEHYVVVVGYKIIGNVRYALIHDPSGKHFRDDDNMFIEKEWNAFLAGDGHFEGWNNHRGGLFHVKGIPAQSHPVIYLMDESIYHLEQEGWESNNYLDDGIKYNTTDIPIEGFDIARGEEYLRYKSSNKLRFLSIYASNPTSEPISITVDIELKGNNDIKKSITIPIGKETDTYKTGDFIEFTESGQEKLFLTAKLDGKEVDEIGPIHINIVKPDDLIGGATCPVDLIIKDPDGLIISKQLKEIPGATYSERDINGDDDPDDRFLIPDRKIGNYQITVIPEHDAEPTETYTLEVSSGDTTIVLAEDVPISDIPAQPYILRSTEEGIFQIIPATVRIEPETLNLGSNGVFTAYIQLPDEHNVSDITLSTVECEEAPATEGKIVHGGEGGHHDMGQIGDTLKVKFNRQDLVDVPAGDAIKLTVTGKVLHNGEEVDFEGNDTIRVIDKGKGK